MDLKTSLIDLQCEMVAERNLVNPKQITWLQYDILYQLKKREGLLPSNLSLILGTSRTKISKALKELKVKGYVEQLPNKFDGRELFTSITESGDKLLLDISKKHTTLYKIVLEVMTKEEQEIFADLSQRFSNELMKKRIEKQE